MIRQLLIALCLLATTFTKLVAQDNNYAGLDSLLTQFYHALTFEDIATKNSEMDVLIEMCSDTPTKQHVATQIFEHYRDSKLMGEEAVAIHVYDKWFGSGKLIMDGEFTQMNAEIFANFNRASLLGMQATPITLRKPCGGTMTIPQEGSIGVLFFYDTSCGKCKLEAKLLPNALKEVDFPLSFYAIYTGEDRREWTKFRRNFRLNNKNIRLFHLWDPKMDSNYQKLYGVTGTPKIFAVHEDREIIGRRLEVDNLIEILNYIRIINGQTKEK